MYQKVSRPSPPRLHLSSSLETKLRSRARVLASAATQAVHLTDHPDLQVHSNPDEAVLAAFGMFGFET